MPRRFGTCWLLTVALCSASQGVGTDAVALLQVRRALAPPTSAPYTMEEFNVGERVEAKGLNHTWLPVSVLGDSRDRNIVHVRVLDGTPNHDLPGVPFHMLRRTLLPNQSDFLVSNALHLRGLGLKYRYSKNLSDSGAAYVPWGSLVTGTDEGNGWVKASMGYLPITFRGAEVLVRREREEKLVVPLAHQKQLEEAARHTATPKPAEPTDAPFAVGEFVDFKTRAGHFHPAYINSLGATAGTYSVIVRPDEFTVNPKDNVPAKQLRHKTTTLPPQWHEGDPAVCRPGGCVRLQVVSPSNQTFSVVMPRASKVEMVLKMVCNKMRVAWSDCQAREQLTRDSKVLSPEMHLRHLGLGDDTLLRLERQAEPTPLVVVTSARAGVAKDAGAAKEEKKTSEREDSREEDPLAWLDE